MRYPTIQHKGKEYTVVAMHEHVIMAYHDQDGLGVLHLLHIGVWGRTVSYQEHVITIDFINAIYSHQETARELHNEEGQAALNVEYNNIYEEVAI